MDWEQYGDQAEDLASSVEYITLEEALEDYTPLEQGLQSGTGFLTQDYNLNSPLIVDYMHATWSFLKNQTVSDRFQYRESEWLQIKLGLEKLGISSSLLRDPLDNHKEIRAAIESAENSCVRINVLERWKQVWDQSKDPPRSTLRHILQKTSKDNYSNRFELLQFPPPELKNIDKEWNLFLDLHFIVHLMNSNLDHQTKDWVKHIFWTKKSKKEEMDKIYFLYDLAGHPRWLVSSTIVISLSTNTVWDKNFVLMMKDIVLARILSTLSLTERVDRGISINDAAKLRQLYKLGDEILSEFGSRGFKGIKLLEAECSERWNQLGHRHRPLIPYSNSLRLHLDKSILELKELGRLTDSMMNIVRDEDDPWLVAQFYGSFRHWGHPYIDYLNGVSELEARVNADISVDVEYANKLASDLAYLVLRSQFQKRHRWYCTTEGLPEDSPLKECIDAGVWPTAKVIEEYGDNWNKLNLIPCFEIPDAIDLADLYSDKAHSITRSEVHAHILSGSKSSIPTKRVMDTLLKNEEINVYEFLKSINDNGLDWDDLVIALKAKERELKDKGRYYSLMGWKLRLYFVITEYLIKKYYVPLFSGITVADDLNTVTKKLLAATEGQGLDHYEKVYIANSIDYEKWNNRQRIASNEPVFRVMGQFLGLPEIFVMTHPFFSSSLIYYLERPDLLAVRGKEIVNLDPKHTLAWEGQKGGFEGLRQKGWSVLNYLVLRREALTRNTKTKFLAQGDNQIVITQYSLMGGKDEIYILRELENIWKNNQAIMSRIREATLSLGLLVNEDEVMTSAEVLIYGKIPVYRGKVLPLETKRWSRITSVTNDQLPSFSNSIASCTTCALAVAQYSDSPEEVLYQHHFFVSLTGALLSIFNSILGLDPFQWEDLTELHQKRCVIRMFYKDPSIGGVCGTNLLRFFLGRFPDPVTESLTWWKILHACSKDDTVREIALEVGNPRLGNISYLTLTMLLENPTSLNIPGGVSSETLIKQKVFEGLKTRVIENTISNNLIKEAVMYTSDHKEKFVMWLFSITPIFPRFISEFFTSTYFKIAESILSVFQNSRTVRKIFSKQFPKELYNVILTSERQSLKSLLIAKVGYLDGTIWECSASRADLLRKKSWGPNLTGVTTPHPAEFLKEEICKESCIGPHIVAKKVPVTERKKWTRGHLNPYLGSKTRESTSILQPWEKQVEIPLLRRACDLRKVINWFVDSGSNLAESIYDNLEKLTGIDMREEINDYRRTGSSKHRLRCSRVSNEGNPAVGFNNLMYVTVTTDSLGEINEENHDFMYQSIICWAGILSTLDKNAYALYDTTHFHISDLKCIRVIKEDVLETNKVFRFPNKVKSVRRMLTKDIDVKLKPRFLEKRVCDWEKMSDGDKSWNIGRSQGFLWGLAVYTDTVDEAATTLFPNTIAKRVIPPAYLDGLHRGFSLGASLSPMYTRYGSLSEKARLKFEGCYWDLVDKALTLSNLSSVINQHGFSNFLSRTGITVIKSYPATMAEICSVLKTWFLKRLVSDRYKDDLWRPLPIVIFAEMNNEYIVGMFKIAESIYPAFQKDRLSGENLARLKTAKTIMKLLADYDEGTISDQDYIKLRTYLRSGEVPHHLVVTSEARHAVHSISLSQTHNEDISAPVYLIDQKGTGGPCVVGEYQPMGLLKHLQKTLKSMEPVQIRCTLFASLRAVQLSTGAHYKYKDILSVFHISGDGIFCGDGSGGIGACHLRIFPNSRVIYNSKLDLTGESWKGLAPLGPGAYIMSGKDIVDRCVNFQSCWEEPSDLSKIATWDTFLRLIKDFNLNIKVICCDAEVQDQEVTSRIEDLILRNVGTIFKYGKGTLIYKTYWSRFLQLNTLPHRIGLYFNKVSFFMPDSQGSFTSEIYVIGESLANPSNPSQTELTIDTMLTLYEKLKINLSPEEEFNRCLGWSHERAILGLEAFVPFSSIEEIAVFLSTVGLETGLSLKVSEILARECNLGLHPINLQLYLGHLLARNVISISRWAKPGELLPSSNQLQRLVAVLFGVWFGITLVMEESTSFETITHYYQEEIPLSFGVTNPVKGRSGKKRQFITWKLTPVGSLKTVDPGPRAGITQQMTRLVRILYSGYPVRRTYSDSDLTRGNELIQEFDKKMTIDKICARSGITYDQLWSDFSPYEFLPYEAKPDEEETPLEPTAEKD